MSNILLDVAEIGKGHEEHKYDSSDKQSIEDMIEYVMGKLGQGFQLYGSKDAEDYVKIFSKNKTAKNDDVKQALMEHDRLVMKEDVKMLLLPPVQGG